MSIPTFVSITPATGDPSGGQEVEIVGTNFRVATLAYTVPAEETVSSVAVTFDGAAAEQIKVVSNTLLRVNVPTATLDPNPTIKPKLVDIEVSRVEFPAVDIIITNLDANGDPIVGETVTAAAAYQYVQPLLRHPEGDSPLLQVFRQYLWLLKRSVVMRVSKQTHTDFGEEGTEITVLSEHPSIGVQLSWLRDPEYSHYDNEPIIVPLGGGIFKNFEISKTLMMVAKLTISARSDNMLLHMITRLIDLQMASPWLIVPPDPDYPIATPNNKYPLEHVSMPEQIGSIGKTNVHAYAATMRVRGIPMLRGDPADNVIYQISTITLSDVDMNGSNLLQTIV